MPFCLEMENEGDVLAGSGAIPSVFSPKKTSKPSNLTL
jgi:hypothetical protein